MLLNKESSMWKKESTQQYTWYVSICAKEREYIIMICTCKLWKLYKILIKTDCEGNGWLGDRDNVPLYAFHHVSK